MSRSRKNGLGFAKTILREGRFAKPRLKIFEIRRDSGFRPAGGCGRNAGRAFWTFDEHKKYSLRD